MKNIYIIAASILLTGFTTSSNAQATSTATATATIVIPISIISSVDMNFGNISGSSTGGVVILPATATTPVRSSSGGVSLPFASGTVTAAKFIVSGSAGYTYALTLPSAPVTLNSDGNSMNASSFTSSIGSTGALSASGSQAFYVGASLSVASMQPVGAYVSTSPFTVTVNYN